MYNILDSNCKFKKLKKDLSLLKEGQLQRFIRTLKKQGLFFENTYENIYPVGSQPSRLYGTPKLHKSFTNVPLCPIVSCINSFNDNLAKYLCNLLQSKIPSIHSTQDTLTFIKGLEEVRDYNSFSII